MRLQHAKRVKSKSRPRQRKPNPPKPGQQRMLVVDRACGRSGTLTGGFLRASSQGQTAKAVWPFLWNPIYRQGQFGPFWEQCHV